jgi:hypothetical protein
MEWRRHIPLRATDSATTTMFWAEPAQKALFSAALASKEELEGIVPEGESGVRIYPLPGTRDQFVVELGLQQLMTPLRQAWLAAREQPDPDPALRAIAAELQWGFRREAREHLTAVTARVAKDSTGVDLLLRNLTAEAKGDEDIAASIVELADRLLPQIALSFGNKRTAASGAKAVVLVEQMARALASELRMPAWSVDMLDDVLLDKLGAFEGVTAATRKAASAAADRHDRAARAHVILLQGLDVASL